MDPFITAIVLTALIISGVWGSIIISSLLKRFNAKVDAPPQGPVLDALHEDHRLLEARVEQLEEELSFYRELQRPGNPTQLPSGDQSDEAM